MANASGFSGGGGGATNLAPVSGTIGYGGGGGAGAGQQIIPGYASPWPGGTQMPPIVTPGAGSGGSGPYPSPLGGVPYGQGQVPTGTSSGGGAGYTDPALLPTGGTFNQMGSSLQAAGFPKYIAGALANFLGNGAGFNPQVAQWLIQAMQPQIQQGEATLEEQYGGAGLGGSSSAQYGLGQFLGQVNLNEGQIFSNLYEQSVQNYLNVLMAGNQKSVASAGVPQQGIGSILGGAGSLLSGLGSL